MLGCACVAVFRMSAVHSASVWCLSRNARPVTIKAVLANAYVCISTRGKVYSSVECYLLT